MNQLKQYLHLEDRAANIEALESYLKDRRVIPQQFDESSNDLDRLVLELFILFKRAKYDEIMQFSRGLERSLIFVPEAKKRDYSQILQIVGDAFQKTGNFKDAEQFYRKALQIERANLETLLRLRQAYNRLNDEKKLLEVNAEIEKVTTPQKVDFKNFKIRKGQVFKTPLTLDGQNIVLDIYFDNNGEEIIPLLSVFFNDRVIWDGYAQNGVVSTVLGTKTGQNVLQVSPVNCPISLGKLVYRKTQKTI